MNNDRGQKVNKMNHNKNRIENERMKQKCKTLGQESK